MDNIKYVLKYVFKPFDLLVFLLPALVLSILTYFVSCSDAGIQPTALMVVMTSCFVFVAGAKAFIAQRFMSEYDMWCKCDIKASTNGYNVSLEQLNAEIDRLISLYSAFSENVPAILSEADVFLKFNPGVINNSFNPTKPLLVAGFTVVGGNYIEVAFFNPKTKLADPNQDIQHTAFAHELGHVILGSVLGNWDESIHHKFMADNKLP